MATKEMYPFFHDFEPLEKTFLEKVLSTLFSGEPLLVEASGITMSD